MATALYAPAGNSCVTNSALAFSLPIEGSNWNSFFIARDKPIPPRPELPSAAFSPVSDGYFEKMSTKLVAGRLFDRRDTPTSTNVTIVNERLAKRVWPAESPLGKSIKQGWPESPGTWREVVGVVADVKFDGVAVDTPMQVYLPLTQESARALAIIVDADLHCLRDRGADVGLRRPVRRRGARRDRADP